MGLGGYVTFGAAAEVADGTRWNHHTQNIEFIGTGRSRARAALENFAWALPGLAANTTLAATLDLSRDFIFSTKDVSNEDPSSYSNTMMKANMLLIGKLVLLALVPSAGNASFDAKLIAQTRASPLLSSLEMAVLGPFIEEVIFRLIPFQFDRGWKLGVGASAGFALVHNFGTDGFSLTKIPITQFIGGMYYWYLMREKGFDHALLAHAANNNVFLMGLNFNSWYP